MNWRWSHLPFPLKTCLRYVSAIVVRVKGELCVCCLQMKILGNQVCPFSVIHSQKVKISILMKTFQRTDGLRKILYCFTCSFLLNMEEPLGYKLKCFTLCSWFRAAQLLWGVSLKKKKKRNFVNGLAVSWFSVCVYLLSPSCPVFVDIFLSPKNYSKWEEK